MHWGVLIFGLTTADTLFTGLYRLPCYRLCIGIWPTNLDTIRNLFIAVSQQKLSHTYIGHESLSDTMVCGVAKQRSNTNGSYAINHP